jgi:hypothetical protein
MGNLPRRSFLVLGLGLALSVGSARADEPKVCAKSYAGDPERRASLHYTEQAADTAKACEICQYFEPRGSCGNCRILETLVNPAGTCDSWSRKAE